MASQTPGGVMREVTPVARGSCALPDRSRFTDEGAGEGPSQNHGDDEHQTGVEVSGGVAKPSHNDRCARSRTLPDGEEQSCCSGDILWPDTAYVHQRADEYRQQPADGEALDEQGDCYPNVVAEEDH